MPTVPPRRPKREIRIEGDLAYIPLTQGKEAVIDAKNVSLVSAYAWQYHPEGYAAHKRWNSTVYLHRLITNGERVDHINGNRLDCREANMRPATIQQNAANRRKVTKHPYKGIRPRAKKWAAEITVNRKYRHLGTFETPEEAALAYNKAALEAFGEFASLNDVDTELVRNRPQISEIDEKFWNSVSSPEDGQSS